MPQRDMTDAELDAILTLATRPVLPVDAENRLLQRVAAGATVVPFRRPEQSRPRLGWLAGLPLAASLALGIYLGSAEVGTDLLSLTTTVQSESDADFGAATGIEEVEDLTEDDLT